MSVTWETSQTDRSWLKAPAPRNMEPMDVDVVETPKRNDATAPNRPICYLQRRRPVDGLPVEIPVFQQMVPTVVSNPPVLTTFGRHSTLHPWPVESLKQFVWKLMVECWFWGVAQSRTLTEGGFAWRNHPECLLFETFFNIQICLWQTEVNHSINFVAH